MRRGRYVLPLVLLVSLLLTLSAWLPSHLNTSDNGHGTSSHIDERIAAGEGLFKQVVNDDETNDAGNQAAALGANEGQDRTDPSDPDKLSSPYILTQEEQALCRNTGGRPVPRPSQREKGRTKLILYWQEGDHFPESTFSERCSRPTSGPCSLTFDPSQQARADAVVFHASRIEMSAPPFQKPPGQIWVARGLESPPHWFSGYRSPGWRGVFNWTMTYGTRSDLFSPVGLLVRADSPPQKDYRRIAARKTRSVAWFVSTCHTQYKYGSRREDYAKELGQHIDVDVFGQCGVLSCPKHPISACDDLLTRGYRFYLSFENSLCKEYVTEKFFNKFREHIHVIPVVLGGADYRKYFPDGTYIDTADFTSPKDLARHLKALGKNLQTYAAMLERKARYTRSQCKKSEPFCKLCDMLHETNLTSKVYQDLPAWVETDACVHSSNLSYHGNI